MAQASPSLSHVALNAVFLEPRMGGMVTYVQHLVPELRRLRPEVRLSLLVPERSAAAVRAGGWVDGVDVVTHKVLGVRYASALSEAVALPRIAQGLGAELIHSLAMTGPVRSSLPHVVTVPDLIWWRRPESSGRITTALWRRLVPPVARGAERVLTLSEASKRDIVELLRVPPERVDVTLCGPGVDVTAAPTDEGALREALALDGDPLVLCVSAKRPHKNLVRLIEAMADVRRQRPGAALVVPGRADPHDEQLRTAARRLGVPLHLPGWLAEEDLEGLYAAAACFVYPSLIEGFGLPVLEAMRRGVPVACSERSSVGEVAGDAAELFDPEDSSAIAGAMLRILGDERRAGELADAGRERAGEFSWTATAERTWEAYDRAVAHRHRI
jgi:glycosyltransferase involved in cell wall biosynthesis